MRAFAVFLTVLATTFVSLSGPSYAANPYEAVVTIDDAVVTRYDVDQRTKLLTALGMEGDVRKAAIQQLTEDRLKLRAGEFIGLELPEDALLTGLEEFAVTRNMTIDSVLEILDNSGIDRQSMDDFIESGLVWREVIGIRFRERALASDAEIEAAVAAKKQERIEVYNIAEIALPFAERGEERTRALADQLATDLSNGANFEAAARQFSRAESALDGGRINPIPSSRMPPPMLQLIGELKPGENTRPVQISDGLAILKLISVSRERPPQDPAQTDFDRREAARRELFSQRITAYGEGYLQELRSDALIIER